MNERLPQAPLQRDVNALVQAFNQGDLILAETIARTMTVQFPRFALGWKALGAVLKKSGHNEDALIPMQKAVLLSPADPEAYNNLGVALRELGRADEAEKSCRRAIALKPDYAEAHCTLGNTLKDIGRFAEVEQCYRRALALNPGYVGAYNNLGVLLHELNRLTEAKQCYLQALSFCPDLAEAHNNLGLTLQNLGCLTEALTSYRKALALYPDFTEAHSNLLFALNYMEGSSPSVNLEQAKQYGNFAAKKASHQYSEWPDLIPADKLKVGFVSGDFRSHPVGFFLEGLMSCIDRSAFELAAYATKAVEDDLTLRLKPMFDYWTPIFSKDDATAARRIYEDKVHILIDLSGHTASNRLPVFAYKPAPVQAAWLGYLATTGIQEMDYVLGDPHVTPESEDHHFTERIWRLPQSYICLTPPETDVEIQSLPALVNGYVTFGSFNNLAKMNDTVIKLWSKILQGVKRSKLFLRTRQLADPTVVREVTERFMAAGIASDRVIMEGHSTRSGYFNAFNRVDVALDPFPYPGITTSVEGLWMGVPFVTMRGDRFLSHSGEGIAVHAGLEQWIAADQDDYLKKAVSFSEDLRQLSVLRTNLRKKILSSPLFDVKSFSGHFEAALRAMWNEWLKKNGCPAD